MESKLVKGLYFAGEVLDLDALTGGFNLQDCLVDRICGRKCNPVIKRNIKQIEKEKIWVIMLRLMARLGAGKKLRLPNGLRKKKDIYM